ncbi:MAG: amidase family protein [Alphaproteobacteria bacterium]
MAGLRPTTGRVARAYGFPPLALDFQAIGPMARTVADVKLAFGIVAGPDPRDRLSLAAADAARRFAMPSDKIRIGLVTGVGWTSGSRPKAPGGGTETHAFPELNPR